MKHLKTWALLYWMNSQKGAKFPQGSRPLAPTWPPLAPALRPAPLYTAVFVLSLFVPALEVKCGQTRANTRICYLICLASFSALFVYSVIVKSCTSRPRSHNCLRNLRLLICYISNRITMVQQTTSATSLYYCNCIVIWTKYALAYYTFFVECVLAFHYDYVWLHCVSKNSPLWLSW